MFVSASCASWMKQVPFHEIEQVENWYSFRWNLDAKFRLLCRCMILGLQWTLALSISVQSFSYKNRSWYLLKYMVLHIDERHRQHLRRVIFVYYLTLFGNKWRYTNNDENDPWRLYKYGLVKKAFVKVLHSSAEMKSEIFEIIFKTYLVWWCN